jgi:hypothetical protein
MISIIEIKLNFEMNKVDREIYEIQLLVLFIIAMQFISLQGKQYVYFS